LVLVVTDTELARPVSQPLTSAPVPTNLPQGWAWPRPAGAGAIGGPGPRPAALMHASAGRAYGGAVPLPSLDTSRHGGAAYMPAVLPPPRPVIAAPRPAVRSTPAMKPVAKPKALPTPQPAVKPLVAKPSGAVTPPAARTVTAKPGPASLATTAAYMGPLLVLFIIFLWFAGRPRGPMRRTE